MAIHRKLEDAKPGARLLLESKEPVDLPAAEVNAAGVTLEREDFRPHIDQLIETLRTGVTAQPAPVVLSDSVFVIEASSRTFWVRIWHSDGERTLIDRMHVTSCVPRIPGLRLPNFK